MDDRSALDLISQAKVKKYRDRCSRDYWLFEVFAVDSLAALSPSARRIAKVRVKRLVTKAAEAERAAVATEVWRGLSAAAIYRASLQFSRATELDSPAGLPLHRLDWPANKKLRTSHWHNNDNADYSATFTADTSSSVSSSTTTSSSSINNNDSSANDSHRASCPKPSRSSRQSGGTTIAAVYGCTEVDDVDTNMGTLTCIRPSDAPLPTSQSTSLVGWPVELDGEDDEDMII